MDVRPLLARVAVPTLVTHAREDALVPFAVGRSQAARFPAAQFVTLDSEPAWEKFVTSLTAFLG